MGHVTTGSVFCPSLMLSSPVQRAHQGGEEVNKDWVQSMTCLIGSLRRTRTQYVRTHWSPKSVLPKRVWNGGSQAFVCSRITRGYLKQISGSQWPQGSWLRTSGGGWGRVFLTSSQALLIWSGGRGGEPHLAHHVCFTHFCYSDMASGFNHFSCHFGVKRIWWHVWWCLPRNPI